MPAHADTRVIAHAFLLATKQLARLDEQVFAHLRASNVDKIIDQIMPLTLDALRPFVDTLTRAMTEQARNVASLEYLRIAGRTIKAARSPFGYIAEVEKAARFSKPEVDQDAIRKNVAKLVVEITSEQRKALKKVIARRYDKDSLRNDTLVKDIKRTVGLTEREASAVMNLRDSLVERELPDTRIENEVGNYSDKLHQLRAQRIARTESVRVETQGRRAAFKSARQDGLLSKNARVEWVSNSEACPECQRLNGKTTTLDGTFATREGKLHGPPLHPHCACDILATDD